MNPLRVLGDVDNQNLSPTSAWEMARVHLSGHFAWPGVAARILKTHPDVQPELHELFAGICKRRDRSKVTPAVEIRRVRASYRRLQTWLTKEEPDALLALGIWAAQTQHLGLGVDDLVQHLPWRNSWNIAKALHKTKQGLDDESKEDLLRLFQQFVLLVQTQAHDIQPWELSIPDASLIE